MLGVRRGVATVFRTAYRAGRRGLTLIELMIVLLLIAILMAVGGLGIAGLSDASVDTSASLLTGAMRYAHSLALQENRTFRLVIDMDERLFWMEVANTDDPCARFAPEGDAARIGGGEADDDKASDDPKGAASGPTFVDVEDMYASRPFEDGSNVTGVITALFPEVQAEGRVPIYFYPNGYVEPALVWVGSEVGGDKDAPEFEAEITLELHNLGNITRHGDVLEEHVFLKDLH